MSTDMPATGDLHLVVGYDGSAPAVRALDGAVDTRKNHWLRPGPSLFQCCSAKPCA